ncbi:MAG: hypothetical protein ABIH52_01865 [Candidatus Aenigmatarchaeota archaeon]
MRDLLAHKIRIVRKLNQWEAYGGTYKNIQRLQQGLPSYMRDMTAINKAIKELQKEDVVILHKKNTCISLNPHEKEKIRKYLSI